jgi:hypothetical protein
MTRKHTSTHQPTVEQGDSSQGYPDGSKLLIGTRMSRTFCTLKRAGG